MYWQRVTVQDYTETQSDTGAVIKTWTDFIEDAEARIMPLDVSDIDKEWATPEEAAYEVQFRGALDALAVNQRVDIDGEVYEFRRILHPPPFGTPTTIAWAVKVTP